MFTVMKVLEMLAAPSTLVVTGVLAAAVLLGLGRPKGARVLLSAVLALLLLLALPPWSDWLLLPLENRFPAPTVLPERVDGIVVLGGAIDPVVSAARGQPSLNGAADRLTALVALSRRYPDARVIFSGGSGSITQQEFKEAPVARALLASLGMDVERMVFEGDSRNTRENALYSRVLGNPRPGETWLLVTSALHMPRAVGAFRAAGWAVVPYPVDYLTTGLAGGSAFSIDAGSGALRTGLHEWAGMVYYRLRGWSDSWYPGL